MSQAPIGIQFGHANVQKAEATEATAGKAKLRGFRLVEATNGGWNVISALDSRIVPDFDGAFSNAADMMDYLAETLLSEDTDVDPGAYDEDPEFWQHDAEWSVSTEPSQTTVTTYERDAMGQITKETVATTYRR